MEFSESMKQIIQLAIELSARTFMTAIAYEYEPVSEILPAMEAFIDQVESFNDEETSFIIGGFNDELEKVLEIMSREDLSAKVEEFFTVHGLVKGRLYDTLMKGE